MFKDILIKSTQSYRLVLDKTSMKLLLVQILVFILFSNVVKCGKILGIFQAPSKSHHILGSKLMQALAKKGHQVSMISPFPAEQTLENYTHIIIDDMMEVKKGSFDKKMHPNTTFWEKITGAYGAMKKLSKKFWKNKDIQKLIGSNETFDAMIVVPAFNDAVFGLAHQCGAVTILFSPVGSFFGVDRYTANPHQPYTLDPLIPASYVDVTTFLGRLVNILSNLFFHASLKYLSDPFQQSLLTKYLPNAPPLEELQNNVSLVLVNSHFSFESARPYLPNMIQIGGFHMADIKKLPKDLEDYLNDAEKGAILMTFGTNVLIGQLDSDKLQAMLKGFENIAPVKVLIKSEIDLPNLPKNVKTSKWLPQNDILAHPNVKAFVSHGGLGGTMEAIYNAVPLIGIPFFGDQEGNVFEARKAGFAIYIDYKNLTEENFTNALKEMLHNSKYKNNIEKRSALLRDQPVKPVDNAIFWIEHVMKYGGGTHLKNAGMNLTWYQLYYVDIILFLVFSLLVLAYVNYKITKCVICALKRKLFSKKLKTN